MTTSKPHIPQEALDLYDAYCHGAMTRRDFFDRLGAFAIGGTSVAALAAAILPEYANAQQTSADDPALSVQSITYSSPNGAGEMGGDLVIPASADGPVGGVVVIHENRGLNPHIKDVARRVGLAGYVALAPDALYPLGGHPGNDDDGRALQRQRDRGEMLEDFMAAAEFLRDHPACSGKVACVGFCFGGAISNLMAVRQPWLSAAVPFYGGWPLAADAQKVDVPLLIHLASLDERVNAGWPPYRTALDAAEIPYTTYFYEGANHGFHNDTTPRYDKEAAAQAWSRTVSFFDAFIGT